MTPVDRTGGIPVDFDPFAGGEFSSRVETTEAQKEIWSSFEFGREANCAFNESLWLEFRGGLDGQAMVAALHDVIDRHEALRTTFSPDGRYLCIGTGKGCEPVSMDLSGRSQAEQEEEIRTLQRQEAVTPFDLVRGPLLRLYLVRLAPEHHGLLITMHHIICDGWSFWIFLEDLAALYNARKNNTLPRLQKPTQFSQYAEELKRRLRSGAADKDLAFWRDQLTPQPEPLDLPLLAPRPCQRTFSARRLDYALAADLSESVQRTAGRLNVSLTAFLLSSFACYLQRICRQDDVVIGVPVAGQATSGYKDLIGHCVNLLPLRFQVRDAVTFAEFCRECATGLIDGYEHHNITYGTLVQELKLAREPGRPPLVSVVFNLDQDLDAVSFDGLELSVFTPPRVYENFDLFVNLVRNKTGMTMECQYQTALFDEAAMRRLLDGFHELLAAVAVNPEMKLAELPILSRGERVFLLERLNDTAADLPAVANFIELFRQQVERDGTRQAAVFGDASLTYAELDQHSNRIAAYLGRHGVESGSLVGIYLSRSLDMLVAVLGVLKAGAGYVPMDPAYPTERLQYMITDSGLELLISEKGLDYTSFGGIRQVIDLGQERKQIQECEIDPASFPCPTGDAIAYVIYTSGSTGRPKGVAVSQQCLLSRMAGMREKPGMVEQDRVLAVATLSFDMSVAELFLPLATGAAVVIAAQDDVKDGSRLIRLLEKQRITYFFATPASWRLLLASGWQGNPDMKGLIGGENLPRILAKELVQKVDQLWNVYGPTETTVIVTAYRLEKENPRILLGKAIPNTRLYVLDKHRQPVPRGVPGELYIGGPGVSLGYLGRPDLTNRFFVPNPVTGNSEDIVYRSGDLVRFVDDGNLEYLGRLDNQVKLRGYRIELGEIESAVNEITGIKEVVADICSMSEDDQRLVVYIRNEQEIDLGGLKKELSARLPSYMVPGHFMYVDTFPLTASGKIDRGRLPEPDLKRHAEYMGPAEPRDDFEYSLVEVWRKVLGVEEIGINDNFFELGGHSLLVLVLIEEMKKATGIDIPYGAIFKFPTIRELTDSLGAEVPKKASCAIPLQPEGDGVPLFCLCSINLYRYLAPSLGRTQPVYAIYVEAEQALLQKAAQGMAVELSIETLAKAYVREILRLQRQGPYQLLGLSFGGIVAIEAARLLQARGLDVYRVFMLDTILPKARRKKVVGSLKYHAVRMRRDGFGYLLDRFTKRASNTLFGQSRSATDAPDIQEIAARFREISFLKAMDDYQKHIEPYHGDVVLVRATDPWAEEGLMEYSYDYGWSDHIMGNLEIVQVPGDHLGIISREHVHLLAEKLVPFLCKTVLRPPLQS